MDDSIDHELFKNQIEEFDKHLNLDGNYRIIFSGRFGIGKTTFLKHFFDMPKNKEKYRAIHLFPVNYSVAENADIFEYIKYDVVAHLLSKSSDKEIDLDQVDIPRRLAYPHLLSQTRRTIDVIAPLLHFFGPTGKVFDGYKRLFEKLEEERKEAGTDDKTALINFLKEAQNQPGSPYEQDFYSQLINELLDKWKGIEEEVDDSKNGIETVLIVDDLDRVDPQHIFRLLNVFAAHFDTKLGDNYNKFRFDKVIFVCDEANIRSIFRHYYGIKADFNGYLDKFYSKEIYPFRIREDVLNKLPVWIDEFYSRAIRLPPASYSNPERPILSLRYFTEYVLKTMILCDAINIRSLSKFWFTSDFTVKDEPVNLNSTLQTNFRNSICLASIEVIRWLVGNLDDFILAIDKCIDYTNKLSLYRNAELEAALLVHLPNNVTGRSDGEPNVWTYHNLENKFSANFKYEEQSVLYGNPRHPIDIQYAANNEYKGNDDLRRSSYDYILLKDLVRHLYL